MLRRRVAVIAALAMLVVAAPALALVRDRPANPGNSGNAPGQSGSPGNSGNAPGQTGSPGNSGNAPGQSGDAPGNSGNAPGQSGDAPGNSGNAPGQPGDAPGNSGNAPGHSGEAPGNSGDAPGKAGEAAGQPGEAPGRSGAAPGRAPEEAPPADATGAAEEVDPELLPKPGRPAAVAEAVVTRPTRGTVLVKTPGMEAKVPLEQAAQVPVGSKVDARAGEVVVRTALPSGGTQAITLAGSKFVLRQEASGMTTIVLRGGDFSACDASAPMASAASARGGKGKRKKGVRRLFASDDDGKFRTHGANSVATVRGTEWVTVDRCDGTLTIVREGSVVVHDEARDRDVVVRAGERYLARAPR